MSPDPSARSERHRRIRRLKTLLRPLPRRATVHRYPIIRWFANAARARPYLWSFRASSLTPALYAGSILALMPTYGFQVAMAFAAALLVRGNLATLVGLQFITNPLTAAPVYYATYLVGTFLIGLFGQTEPASLIGRTAYALVVGGTACGLALGCILDLVHRFLRYEAKKHHWHLPRRVKNPSGSTSQSPTTL